MTDIVERLRKWAGFGYGAEASETMREAADEIERLREALQRLAKLEEFVGGEPSCIEEVMNYTQYIARAALGEDKE